MMQNLSLDRQPYKEKINTTSAVLTERTVDVTPVIQFDKNFYKMINHK